MFDTENIYDDTSDFNNQMLLNQNIQGAGLKLNINFILQCFEALGNTTINSTVTFARDLDHLGLINKLYFDEISRKSSYGVMV